MKRFSISLCIVFIVNLIITMVVFPSRAQDNIAAGLFCEARQLPVISHGMNIQVVAGEAEITVEQIFLNDGPDVGQADFRMHLPAEATVEEFGFWNDGRYLKATLKSKEEAQSDHEKAAMEGRSTGILNEDGDMQHFSVYPLGAAEQKRVRLRFTLPVATELGRSHVRIPVEHFLGQGAVWGIATVSIVSGGNVETFGVEGAEPLGVQQVSGRVKMLLNINQAVELWWKEAPVPLTMTGSAVAIGDQQYAVELRVAMDKLESVSSRPARVHVFLDGSVSMKQKSPQVRQLLERLWQNLGDKMNLYVATDRVSPENSSAEAVVAKLANGAYGHRFAWDTLTKAMEETKCHQWDNHCVVITDLQMLMDGGEGPRHADVVWLASPHEKAFFEDRLMNRTVHVAKVDSVGQLDAIADELVLPVLQLRTVTAPGNWNAPAQKESLALGGRLSVFGSLASLESLSVEYAVDGKFSKSMVVPLEVESGDSAAGKRIRKGYYRAVLGQMMTEYRQQPDDELQAKIVEISLREEIPTAFTSLQVDDPSLSLFSMKPGDPILTVHNEPGLQEVFAVYPFGKVSLLAYDKSDDTFTDRFLVPRGWRDQNYKISVFKRMADGTVKPEYAWYQIDRIAPAASVGYDPEHDILSVVPESGGMGIGSVQLHRNGKAALDVSPVKGVFMVQGEALSAQSEIRIRDRAGNLTRFVCEKSENGVSCSQLDEKQARTSGNVEAGRVVGLSATGAGLEVDGDEITATLDHDKIRFSMAQSKLNSLSLTGFTRDEAGNYWLGTALGDVVKVECTTQEHCDAVPLKNDFYGHAITGMVSAEDGRIWVAVIGKGIYTVERMSSKRARLQAKSRYVTGLVKGDDALYYGTLDDGLYRITNGKGKSVRFSESSILKLWWEDGELRVETPRGCYAKKAGGKWVLQQRRISNVSPSADVSAAVKFNGQTFVAGFNSGLLLLDGGVLKPIPLPLSVMQQRINSLAVYQGQLYLGTEAGLLTTDLKAVFTTSVTGAVHDMAVGAKGLALASAQGLYLLREGTTVRLDVQAAGKGRFSSVAFWHDRVVAGNIDGLYWFTQTASGQYGVDENWGANDVTALAVKDNVLYVGTYNQGVYACSDNKFHAVKGLASQWVPPHGLRLVNNTLWAGGMGMNPKRQTKSGSWETVHIPARDVNDFFPTPQGTLLLTSDGIVQIKE